MHYSKFNKLTTYNLVNYTSTNSANLINYKIMSDTRENKLKNTKDVFNYYETKGNFDIVNNIDLSKIPYLETTEVITHRHWNKDYDQNAICKCGYRYSDHFDYECNNQAAPHHISKCNNFELRTADIINQELIEVTNKHRELTDKITRLNQELKKVNHV